MVSCWYLLRNKHIQLAKRSIVVAATFGLIASIATAITGDESAYDAAQYQPMKLAAFEGLYKGHKGEGIVALGVLEKEKKPGDDKSPFTFEFSIPHGLAILATRSWNGFVPGIDDLVYGNAEEGIEGVAGKIEKGKKAIADLAAYKAADAAGNEQEKSAALARFRINEEYMGFGYMQAPEDAVPSVPTTFYSFHYMVFAGSAIIGLMLLFLWAAKKGGLERRRLLQLLGLLSFPMMYLASEFGWVVAEVGRQPWVMEGKLLTSMASTQISSGSVKVTFFVFLALFTVLALAEVAIMIKQINIGPEEK